MPTINPVYNQKGAWLPFTVIIFPGMLLSYFRRFDSGRGTTLYLITSVITFLIGTVVWTFIILFSPVAIPFGIISGSCMFALLLLFAYRRQELQVLWDGKFYDEEFVDREDMDSYKQLIELQAGREDTVQTIDSIVEGLCRESNFSIQSNRQGRRTSEIKTRNLSNIKSNIDPKEEEPSQENNNIIEIKEENEENDSPPKEIDDSNVEVGHSDNL